MKRLLRSKWIKAVSFILAAASLPVTICAAIVFCVCMYKGFTVTGELKISGEDVSFREQEFKNIAEENRYEVINGMYDSLLYNAMGSYSQYIYMYSEENSNYFFKIIPEDDSLPQMSNYYNKDYQYKNTGKYTKEYYEHVVYNYPYSLTAIAEEWLNQFNEEYGSDKNYDYMYISMRDELLEKMTIDVTYSDRLMVTVDGYSYEIDLMLDSDFIQSQNEFEQQYMSGEYMIYSKFSSYDMSSEQIVSKYTVMSHIDLEYTEYVKKELTAHDEFYYSPILKYADIIENYTMPALIGGFMVFLLSSVLLCLSAGRKQDREDTVCGIIEKIPIEILLLIFAAAAFMIVMMLDNFDGRMVSYKIITAILMAGILSLMYPVILSTVAVRIKAGILFKDTIIYKIYRRIKKVILYLWRNINIYGKVLGIYGAITLIKYVLVGAFSYYMMPPSSWVCMWITDIILAVLLVVSTINMSRLKKGAVEIAKGNTEYKIDTSHMLSEFKKHGEVLNSIGNGIQAAVEEQLKSERMKTELITNVSHDIKTPITSIISYVDLLDKENMENEKAKEYIEVLKRQSERLKKLVQDLIDASKASTGNMPVSIEQININVMLEQIIGESMEKLLSRSIRPVVKYGSENAMASADGRLLQRCFDNLIQNICKYAMEESRVYIDVEESNTCISVTLKNISKNELNVSGDELMERFVRGDSSRNTEGSGLGLSIAKSLMEIQGGSLNVIIDGDLFKAVVVVKKCI